MYRLFRHNVKFHYFRTVRWCFEVIFYFYYYNLKNPNDYYLKFGLLNNTLVIYMQ